MRTYFYMIMRAVLLFEYFVNSLLANNETKVIGIDNGQSQKEGGRIRFELLEARYRLRHNRQVNGSRTTIISGLHSIWTLDNIQ